MITTSVPETWQELQASVARILEQCGFAVDLERRIETVRGQVEIDVYAEENISGRKNIILCECKHWRGGVPQNVIHAFRTVTADFGANAGYIIALKGFQAGAFAAVNCTNVQLVTWEQFQQTFEATWFEEHLSRHLTRELDPLLSCIEPWAPKWLPALSKDDKTAVLALVEKHSALGLVVMMLSRYARRSRGEALPQLPISEWNQRELEDLPDDVRTATAYADLEGILLDRGRRAIEEFRVYQARAIRNSSSK